MKTKTLITALAAVALFAPPLSAQSTGDFFFQKKPADGPLNPVWVTPENNKAFGINSSGVPAMLSISGGSSTLAGLSDVALTSVAGNDLLRYNSGSGKWANVAGSTYARAADLGALAALNAVTSATITNGTITNDDIAADAAIDFTKVDHPTTLEGYGISNLSLNGKTLQFTGSIVLDGEDGAHLDIGSGGTLGTAAYTAATNYEVPLTFGFGLARTDNDVSLDPSILHTTGENNLFIGEGSGNLTLTGAGNVGIGRLTLSSLAGGHDNLGLGYVALNQATSGYNNTALGRASLFQISSGHDNIAVGYAAGYNLTTSNNNIDIGNLGTLGDSGIIRIGTSGTHTAAYIAGTLNATLANGSVSNAMLANSAITINGSSVSLGGSATISTGLTIGTTTITSGTTGRYLYNNSGVVGERTSAQVLSDIGAQASGSYAVLTANTFSAAQTLPAGSASATSLNFGTAGTGIYSSSSTNSIDFAIGGSRRWYIDSSGTLQGGSSSVQLTGNMLGVNFFARGGYYAMGASDDVVWQRVAANHGIFARSTNAQTMSVANTFTSTTNYEALTVDWSSNVARIKPTAAGAGTIRTVRYYLTDTVWIGVGSGSPEGVETAGIGSAFHRTDGGAGTSLYVKESGTGNTGWIAK